MGKGALVDGGVGGSGTPGAAAGPEGARSQRDRGLDGLRGLAVIAVLLFHQGFGWARGGYLGVSLFFTLSGFLIARLLLAEVEGTGRIRLGAFWQRRLRRLAVAALAALALVCAYGAWFATESQKLALRGDVWASLAQVANWRFVGSVSYADLFQDPSPVQHFWSLAIEEQFYLVFPVLLAGVVRVTAKLRQPRWAARRVLAGVVLLLMAGSLAAQLVFSTSVDRVYYGTDTRAFELLAGVLLACWWRPHRVASSKRVSRCVSVVGAALLALVVYWWTTAGFGAPWLVHGGFALVAVVSAIVIASATLPGPVRALGSFRPLVAIGLISYGVYLYHWPVFLALDPARTGLDGWSLFALRSGVTVALAVVSYHFLEMPVRRGAFHTPKVAGLAWASGLLVVVMLTALAVPNADRGRVITSTTFDDARSLVASRHAALDIVPPAAAEPLRVYVVGDSTGVMFAAGLAMFAGETGLLDVRSGALEACPLGAVDSFKWYIPQGLVSMPVHPECARLFDRIAADVSSWTPQLVLVVAGPTNTEAFHPVGAPGDTWLLPTDPAGRAVIAAGARRMNEQLERLAPGAPQLWFTAPYILRPDASGGFKDPRGPQVPAFTDVYNSVIRDLAEGRPLIATVPWADVFNSTPVNLDPRSQIDGVHARPSVLLGILRTWFPNALLARDRLIAEAAEGTAIGQTAPL